MKFSTETQSFAKFFISDRKTPTELLGEFVEIKPTLSVGDGMTLTSSLLRRLAPDNYTTLFFSFDYDWHMVG